MKLFTYIDENNGRGMYLSAHNREEAIKLLKDRGYDTGSLDKDGQEVKTGVLEFLKDGQGRRHIYIS